MLRTVLLLTMALVLSGCMLLGDRPLVEPGSTPSDSRLFGAWRHSDTGAATWVHFGVTDHHHDSGLMQAVWVMHDNSGRQVASYRTPCYASEHDGVWLLSFLDPEGMILTADTGAYGYVCYTVDEQRLRLWWVRDRWLGRLGDSAPVAVQRGKMGLRVADPRPLLSYLLPLSDADYDGRNPRRRLDHLGDFRRLE